MLKVKDWIINKGEFQFSPLEFVDDTIISKVIRIKDNEKFSLLSNSGFERYHYDITSGETIKITIGIVKFDIDRTHVFLGALGQILNKETKSAHVKVGVQINDVEKYYQEVFEGAREKIIKIIQAN